MANTHTSNASWENLLREVNEGNHIAQVYQDENFLVDAVGLFISTGIKKEEAIVIIATHDHWNSFSAHLEKSGIDVPSVRARGQLTVLDAHETLASFMAGDMPDWEKFKQVITPVVEKARAQGKYPKIRAYGEMVDILWRKGNLNGAIRLEELWNDFMKLHAFSLFCAYTMDGLDIDVNNGPLQAVCKTHSHFIPTKDYNIFERALEEATQKILGSSLSSMVRTIATTDKTVCTHMPAAQTVLLWLKDNMPVTADKVLSYTRHHLEALQKA